MASLKTQFQHLQRTFPVLWFTLSVRLKTVVRFPIVVKEVLDANCEPALKFCKLNFIFHEKLYLSWQFKNIQNNTCKLYRTYIKLFSHVIPARIIVFTVWHLSLNWYKNFIAFGFKRSSTYFLLALFVE